MFMDSGTSKKYFALETAVVLFMSVCLLPVISKPCLLFDEAFSINMIRRSVPDLIRLTGMDVHPPLYYLLSKLFITVLGDSLFVFHLPPLLCYLGLILLSAWFLNRYFDPRLSFLMTICLCGAPNLLFYALQIRMYSMAMLLLTGSYCLVYIIMKKYEEGPVYGFRKLWKYWTGLALINVAAAYTQYFAGVAAVGISLFLLGYLLLKKRQPRVVIPWLIYCGIMFVLYLPWLPVLFGQMGMVGRGYWIEPLTEAVLHGYPEIVFAMTDGGLRKLLIVLFLAGSFLCVFYCGRETEYVWVMGCFVVLGIWLVMGVGYSVLRSPILADRYLVMLLPLIWIPPLYGFYRSGKGYLMAGAVLVFLLCFIANYEERYDHFALDFEVPLVDTIETRAREDDIFFHFYFGDLYTYEALFPEHEHYVLSSTFVNEQESFLALTRGHVIDSLEELPDTDANIWCSNGDWVHSFEGLGYEIETIDLGTASVYRVYKQR